VLCKHKKLFFYVFLTLKRTDSIDSWDCLG